MDVKNARFIEALKAALQNSKVEWEAEMSQQEWMELFKMADAHHVLPMIYEAVYACPAARRADPRMLAAFKSRVMQAVRIQIMKTDELLALLRHLKQAGIELVIVKGIVCRELYPQPDYRMSGDEDILIRSQQYAQCHEALMAFGMVRADVQQDAEQAYEVPYGKPGSPIYIELHKNLFPPESEAYGDLNRFFTDLHDRKTYVDIQGTTVPTITPTDHLFYLICHAFKHFLHSGFGIRQVGDIVLFANRYGCELNWQLVLDSCKAIHAECFAAAVFEIGRKYLTFDVQKACYPQVWRDIEVDETAMLEDLLDSGVYGAASMSRKHSSGITLEAVSASKQGKRAKNRIFASVFPSARKLEFSYPYLKQKPYLLPAAWVERIMKYYKETRRMPNNDAAESLRIGKERIDLMRQYRIIR